MGGGLFRLVETANGRGLGLGFLLLWLIRYIQLKEGVQLVCRVLCWWLVRLALEKVELRDIMNVLSIAPVLPSSKEFLHVQYKQLILPQLHQFNIMISDWAVLLFMEYKRDWG